MRSYPKSTALLIVGHGTRSELGRAEFLEAVDLTARRMPGMRVAPAFLELAGPTIAQAVESLAAADCARIVVLPLLLFSAGHAQDDIPSAVADVARRHPHVDVHFAGHLGCHERLLALSAQRFEEAANDEEFSPQDTLWLMVGRGSRDDSALAEMRRFVDCRLRLTPVACARIAYLAMAQPRLGPALAEIAELRFPRVVVQPHLLFHGELLETVAARVAEISAAWPGQQWRIAPRLGAAELLVDAMVDRFWEVASARACT